MAKKKNTKERAMVGKIGNIDRSILTIIYIILGIAIFFGTFYALTIYITNKNSAESEDKKSEEKTEVEIDYEEILMGRSLSMSNDDYLVICYDKTDEDEESTYQSLISEYGANPEQLDVYTVDMGSSFNKEYETDGKSNKNPESVSDIAIKGPTLMKISAGKVTEYIEGEEEISNYLKRDK